MYEIYETEAFVIESYGVSENDRRVLLFTEEFGLIWVDVSAMKKDNSKLKSFLQNFSFSKVFLIRGKNYYRVTGGELIENMYFSSGREKKKLIKIKNIFSLVKRLLIKHHREEGVWDILLDFWNNLKQADMDDEWLEIYYILKLLLILGYFNENFLIELNIDISNNYLEIDVDREKQKKIIYEINQQLRKIAF